MGSQEYQVANDIKIEDESVAVSTDLDAYIQHLPSHIDDIYHILDDTLEFFNDKRERLDKEESTVISPVLLAAYKSSFACRRLTNFGGLSTTKDSQKSGDARTTMRDARPNSKWYNPRRIGQHILYEACDRALADLRGYEHSVPFLTKVSKREAPDYHDIIKEPMDLGTMAKKLKSIQYPSKEAFANDLRLIWSNCLLYNTDPKSIYRYHAQLFERRASQLLATIPDIVIVEKTADDFSENRAKDGAKMDKKYGPCSDDEDNEDDAVWQMGNEEIRAFTNRKKKEFLRCTLNGSDILYEWGQYVDEWLSRQLLLSMRYSTKPFGEHRALVRSSQNMGMYYSHSIKDEKNTTAFAFSNARIVTTKDPFLPEIFYFNNSVPDSIQKTGNDNAGGGYTELQKVCSWVRANIEKLQTVRWLTQKIDAHQNNQNINGIILPVNIFEDEDCIDSEEEEVEVEGNSDATAERPPESKIHGPITKFPPMTRETNLYFLKRTLVYQLLYTGFEQVESIPLSIMTELVYDYLEKITQMLKVYVEEYSKVMPMQQLVCQHVLCEMGISNGYLGLASFWRETVVRYGQKLSELQRKLENRLGDLLTLEKADVDDKKESDASDFDENDSAFVTGSFGDELGLDFFGLKEMGMENLKVPPSLISTAPSHLKIWKASSRMDNSLAKAEIISTKQYSVKFPLPPIEVNKQIGLMKEFLHKKLEKPSEEEPNATQEEGVNASTTPSSSQTQIPPSRMQLDGSDYDAQDSQTTP